MNPTTELTVEEALRAIREVVGPMPQVCIGLRDCGLETVTSRDTILEYDAQIGINGVDFTGDSMAEVVAQIRAWHSEQRKGRGDGL